MRAVQKTINHWGRVLPYAHVPLNEKEYEKLLMFVDELMEWTRTYCDQDDRATSLLQLISKNIEIYENQKYKSKKTSPAQILKFLMDEHGIGQSDLPEIGSQSLVSKILHGERQLTLDHVHNLCKRFGVSPAVFF